ncbi:GntR family transcriptional regulator [Nocardioides sp. TRM66260-LWL]|uniref:GntR family transcriptional regulator n=1 Tax=Nocardioides sp. TRM66260-LWL TaxID=2874478 RepID=UPI001CC447B5|nr:GntR family transcriptional regulator [Nocardioides sp. TRM66260-LWL]MBZ5733046.1 GntR family transcriptional regulator [Nocardioides sp. TRM66260-LWL]
MSLPSVRIDATSAEPPFEQLRRQVREQVEAGTLAAGTRLPPVRALAAELGLAPNTVARAYRELEADGVLDTRGRADGVLDTRGRAGTFVAGRGVDAEARAAARAYAERIVTLGLSPADALRLVEDALRRG